MMNCVTGCLTREIAKMEFQIRSMIQRLAFLFCLALLPSQGFCEATAGPFNYYVPAPDRLLENVEKYHLNKGIDMVKKGEYEFAWGEFAFMLHYFPNHPRALQLIGDLSIQMEQSDRALKYFDRAVRLYSKDAPTFAIYAVFLHRVGKVAIIVLASAAA